MNLSIVTTLYYSEHHLEEFYHRVCASAEKLTHKFEIIFVNDGSPDNSLELALKLHQNDQRVKVIDLSRNYGQHKAIMTGLAYAKGDLVFLLDCDLEEEPELLERFNNYMIETNADVVFGVQETRRGGFLERITGDLFYKLYNFLSDFPVPENFIHARLMKQLYVRNLIKHRDQEVYIAGLWAMTGFKQLSLPVEKQSRGDSTYNFSRKMAMFINAVTSFSSKPLYLIIDFGIFILIATFVVSIFAIIRNLLKFGHIDALTIMIFSLWFLGGVIISCLGIVGIYVSKVLTETKKRPYTVIRHIYDSSNSNIKFVDDVNHQKDEHLELI